MNAEQDRTDEQTAALREELRLVEEELAQARRTAAELRRQIGERWDAPRDSADLATELTAAEEQEALAAALEARLLHLAERLGEDPATYMAVPESRSVIDKSVRFD
jgi:septal ring factor EnvC (AmiA/AmiB activator)